MFFNSEGRSVSGHETSAVCFSLNKHKNFTMSVSTVHCFIAYSFPSLFFNRLASVLKCTNVQLEVFVIKKNIVAKLSLKHQLIYLYTVCGSSLWSMG